MQGNEKAGFFFFVVIKMGMKMGWPYTRQGTLRTEPHTHLERSHRTHVGPKLRVPPRARLWDVDIPPHQRPVKMTRTQDLVADERAPYPPKPTFGGMQKQVEYTVVLNETLILRLSWYYHVSQRTKWFRFLLWSFPRSRADHDTF
jgi:hypothetical protein